MEITVEPGGTVRKYKALVFRDTQHYFNQRHLSLLFVLKIFLIIFHLKDGFVTEIKKLKSQLKGRR